MNTRRSLAALLVCLGLSSTTSAQPSMQAVFGASLDRVEHGDTSTDSSTAPAGSFSVEHFALEERLRVFYTLDGGTFSSEGDWHYLQHGAGARYRFAPGPRTGLFVGGTVALRTNGDSWSSANYKAAGLFANVEHELGRATLRAGARADRRGFGDRPELDQWETGAFASARVSFQTRTTLIGEVSLGWKRFDEGAMWIQVAGAPDVTLPGSTPGQGNMGGGMRPGMWQRPSVLPSTIVNTGGEQSRQVTLFGRVAQSLADRLALTVEATRREAAGSVAPALVTTPEMLIDDGVYDDPFASDATVVRLGLKRVFENGRFLEGGVSRWDKLYGATPAYDVTGAIVPDRWREDDVWRVDLTWSEPIAAGRTGNMDLAVLTVYSFMDSASTDVFYNYRSHRARLMFSIRY